MPFTLGQRTTKYQIHKINNCEKNQHNHKLSHRMKGIAKGMHKKFISLKILQFLQLCTHLQV
jgi:hypothetical protein